MRNSSFIGDPRSLDSSDHGELPELLAEITEVAVERGVMAEDVFRHHPEDDVVDLAVFGDAEHCPIASRV